MATYSYENFYTVSYVPSTGFTVVEDNTGVEVSSSTKILTSGSTITTVPTFNLPNSQELVYQGTAVEGGKYVGAFFYDATDNQTYLLTNNNTDLLYKNISIDYADSPTPGGKANFNVGSGAPTAASCFLAGTMVATPDGDVAVEALRPGDLVRVTDGRAMPVCWVGRQTVSRRFADPMRVLPVRVRAGALGPSQPQRDLLLSPDHALLIDDVLVQAGALVNGVSILRDDSVPQVFTYYHVEVADHALLFAEGVPAETFIDNVDRLAFDNWAEHEAMADPGAMIVEMDLPRAKAARQVPASIRNRLAARATALFSAEVASAA